MIRARVRRLRRSLLAWANVHARRFFWREVSATPFQILVAEILLAKTQARLVDKVAPKVLEAYPDPSALSTAQLRDLERHVYPLGLHRTSVITQNRPLMIT